MNIMRIVAATMSAFLLAGPASAQDGGGEFVGVAQRFVVSVDAKRPAPGKVGRSVGTTPNSEAPVSTDDIKPSHGDEAGCIRSNSGGFGAGNILPGGHGGVATSGGGGGSGGSGGSGGGGGTHINPPASSCPPQAPIPMPF